MQRNGQLLRRSAKRLRAGNGSGLDIATSSAPPGRHPNANATPQKTASANQIISTTTPAQYLPGTSERLMISGLPQRTGLKTSPETTDVTRIVPVNMAGSTNSKFHMGESKPAPKTR